MIGNNMFVYCLNNPVNYSDSNGCAPKKPDPITIEVVGDTMYITMYVKYGKGVDSHTASLIKAGIEGYWSGKFMVDGKEMTVVTTVIDVFDGGHHIFAANQQFVNIDYKNKAGISQVKYPIVSWSKSNPGKMILYGYFPDGSAKSDVQIMWSAAHEFGHLLGLASPTNNGNFGEDIMNVWYEKVTSTIIELVKKAFDTNKKQYS